MTSVLLYLLKASLGLGATYAFYRWVLEPSAHFRLNRLCLLGLTLLSLALPLSPWSYEVAVPAVALEWQEATAPTPPPLLARETVSHPAAGSSLNWTAMVVLAWALGLAWHSRKLGGQLLQLARAYRQSTLEQRSGYRLRWLPEAGPVFSFGRSVFVGQNFGAWSPAEQAQALAHEQVHLRRGHSWERLALEGLHLCFWFHPCLPALKRSWHELQELEADAAVIRHENPHQYARLLVKAAAQPAGLSLATGLAQSPVIRRVRRILQPGQRSWGRYLWLLPMLLLMGGGLGLRYGQAADLPIIGPVLAWQEFLAQPHSDTPTLRPMEGRISSGFGMRMHPILKKQQMHTGVDIVAPTGTPVYASASGKVLLSGVEEAKKAYGVKVELDHGRSGYQTLYAQLSHSVVKPGETVQQGQLIGYCGSSGMSTASHLHFAVRKDGKFINPVSLWAQ
mgnify:CR=1 FL=1